MFRGFFFVFGPLLLLAQGALVRHQYWRIIRKMTVFCVPHLPIAYYLAFTNRKRKYFEETMTATLKIKLTSITTVQNHILTVACFPTPLIFHYRLPFNDFGKKSEELN
jgi:hypothetical protein